MAFVVTKDGGMVEGTLVQDDQAQIMERLVEELNAASCSYVSGRDRIDMARFLISKYHITKRKQPLFPTRGIPVMVEVLPASPSNDPEPQPKGRE